MSLAPNRPVRPQTASLPFRSSHAAKADAVQWTNQRNLRILLEHLTAALLEAKPDDPLIFIREFLEERKENEEMGGFTWGAREEGDGTRPATSGGTSGRPGTGRGEQALEKIRADCKHWESMYQEQCEVAAQLESEIQELEDAMAGKEVP